MSIEIAHSDVARSDDSGQRFNAELLAAMAKARIAARFHAGGDRVLADDLLQDAVVSAIENQDSYTQGSNMRAWLSTIMRNSRLTSLARAQMIARKKDTIEKVAASAPTLTNQETSMELAQVLDAMKDLPALDQELMQRFCFDGDTLIMLSEEFGMPLNTVKTRINRAREKLRKATGVTRGWK